MSKQEAASVVKDWYDSITGERRSMIEGVDTRKGKCPYKAFTFVSESSSRYLALIKMTGTEYRIWNFLVSHIDWNNAVDITCAKIGQDLEMDSANVRKVLAQLTQRGLCKRIEKPNVRAGDIRLHPYLVWKGDGDAFLTVLSESNKFHDNPEYWDKVYRRVSGFADQPDGWVLS